MIYALFVFLSLVTAIGLMRTALSNVANFTDTILILKDDLFSFPPMTGIEDEVQLKFNDFFFGAANSCSGGSLNVVGRVIVAVFDVVAANLRRQ
jgi:hypothetical protein